MLFNEVLDEYLAWCEMKGFTKKTIKNKKQEYKQLKKFLEDKRGIRELENITVYELQAYVTLKRKEGLKNQSIVSMFKMVKAFFNWCVREGYLESDKNPVSKVILPKVGKQVLTGFSEEEVVAMINAYSYDSYLEARNKAIIVMMADCGLRAMEIRTLRETDIKDTSAILVHGKGNKERIVFMTPVVKRVLIKYNRLKREYFKDRVNLEDRMFLTYQGGEISHTSLWKIIVDAGKRAGITDARCSPHTFRHFFSVQSLANGIDLYTLQRLLGHSEVGTTERYLQTLNDNQLIEKALRTSPLMNINERKTKI